MLILLLNFLILTFRAYDSFFSKNVLARKDWEDNEILLTSENFNAIGYIFVIIKMLFLLKGYYRFSSLLEATLDITADVMKFIVVFGIVIFSFSIGFIHVFQYFNTKEWVEACNSNGREECDIGHFRSIEKAFAACFWMIFGRKEVSKYYNYPKFESTKLTVQFLLVFYHILVNIVMINLLISVMSNIYDRLV